MWLLGQLNALDEVVPCKGCVYMEEDSCGMFCTKWTHMHKVDPDDCCNKGLWRDQKGA